MAVTAFLTALAIGVGNSPLDCLLVGLAVLTGQLSIGWSNDWIDAARDVAVHRSDKPVAAGAVAAGTVRTAAFVAAALCVPLSFTLGWRAGLVNLVAQGAGWAYNAGMKGTAWSWLPYAVAFGIFPAVPTLALPGHPFAPAWAIAAGALLGVGAHLANVLPDFDDDHDTGVRGFPHRIGRRASTLLCPVPLLAASVLITLGPDGPPTVRSGSGSGSPPPSRAPLPWWEVGPPGAGCRSCSASGWPAST